MKYAKAIEHLTDANSRIQDFIDSKNSSIKRNVKDNEILSLDIAELKRQFFANLDAIKYLEKGQT